MKTSIFTAQHIHFTGFKGVAMASLAQCLHDMGKALSGSDVAENFVTDQVLQQTKVQTFIGFAPEHIPQNTDLLIYTAAHKGPENPEVLAAIAMGIEVMSQAQALGELFNEKKGIAVCGVGGKSTTSAMIAWIFSKLNIPISYSVGVGSIVDLSKTGQWNKNSEYFVAEADEYVIDPSAARQGKPITPRFSFLKPQIIICTYIAFDHPDVYKNFEQTQRTFLEFFHNLKPHGTLIIGDQIELTKLSQQLRKSRPDVQVLSFGEINDSNLGHDDFKYESGKLVTTIVFENKRYPASFNVPGKHNLVNACAALLACTQVGFNIKQAMHALSSFQSTQRRFEFKGTYKGTLFYDDYAHHPRELKIIIQTLKEMFPDKPIYLIFQPHTFSRTRALFEYFVDVLGSAPHLVLTEIFASAREAFDPNMSSKLLADSIREKFPHCDLTYLPTLEEVEQFCREDVPEGSVVMTAGAGDVYHIHDKIFRSS